MKSSNIWLTVGKVVSAQGLRGEIRVNPSSDFPERFTRPGKRWLQKGHEEPREIALLAGRKLPGKSIYVLKLRGVDHRNKAEALVGENLLVPAKDRPKLAHNEFHLLDLLGLEARTSPSGNAIGHVTNLTDAGKDLLEIQLLNGRNVLVPFVEAIVPEVKIKEGWLLLSPPPGLMEL